MRTFSCRMLVRFLNHGAVASSKLWPRNAAAAVLVRSSTRGHSTTEKTRDLGPGRATPFRVVDLRTDIVAKAIPAMIRSMAEAASEVLGEDTAVNELQKMAADMFGMEAALFCISTSMGNLIAVMAHCMQRGDEMIVGDVSHLHIFEQGASAQLAGVHSTTVTTFPDGTFDLDQLESKIRHGYPNPHYPRSRLICLENTHTIRGGRVLPLSFLQEVRALADQYGLSIHMDGARVMNAAVAQGVPPSTILQHTHSVSVCLSKGLGAPVGSVLAGSQDFISRATRCRKALGGGIWLAGMLAAAGKLSLQNMVGRLVEDHHNAKTFAQALFDCQPPLFAVDVAAVETNIVRFHLQDPSLTPPEFCARMAQVGKGEEAALGQGIQVFLRPFYGNSIRAVWHHGISPEDTQLAIQKMQFVASQHLKEKVRAQ